MTEKSGGGGTSATAWFHKNIGRMETEKLLMENREDGAFLIRESDTVKGAYVLSTIYQQRIHHYRILPDEEGKLSIQAQHGVQRKHFVLLEELVTYYSQPRRGLVCGLTMPISQKQEESSELDEESDPDDEPDEVVSREKNVVSKFLLASLSTVDTTKVDEVFLERLRGYLSGDVSRDVESMVSSAPQLSCLKTLFAKDCELLHRHLDRVMLEVDLLQSLFGRAGGAKETVQSGALNRRRRSKIGDTDYDSLGFKLNECADSMVNLETTAFQMLRELSVSLSGRPAHSGSLSQVHGGLPMANGEQENSEEVSFDVRIEGVTGKKNYTITVSLQDGTLVVCKPGENQGTRYEHHQVLQLVKSRSKQQRLGILLEGLSRKDYLFNSMQAREHFCQLIQLIRNRLRGDEDRDSISLFVGTWNMADAVPPNDISTWFRSLGLGKTLPTALAKAHDIYAFGTQECSVSEKEWTNKIKYTLKNLYDIDYEKVAFQSLWGIRITIFVRPEHVTKITHLQASQVRTGIGNALGNKGAVGVSFYFGSVSLCFINAHLTSGGEKCNRRNQNYHDILKGMGPLKHKRLSQFDLTNQFHHLFFFGDLNYRVELSAPEIVACAKRLDHYAICQEDQLRKDREKKKIFVGFEEPPILFPPTYRFSRGRRSLDDYVWVKQKRSGLRINVPSYCDRVLWKSYPGTKIANTSYGCTSDIMTSDHSPVFATFQIGGVKQYVPEAGKNMPIEGENTFIIVDSCKAKIQTSSRTYFYLEFHSTCFEGVRRSSPNNDWIEMLESGYIRPVWCGRDHVAKIKPIVTDQAYIEQQHLLMMLRSQESDETYAECCMSLGNLIGPTPVNVQCELTHQGQLVGELDAYMHVTMDHYKEVEEQQGDIYSDMNFITADSEETSLDFRGRSRSNVGESLLDTGLRRRENTLGNRPKMPLPWSSSPIDQPSTLPSDSHWRGSQPTSTSPASSLPPVSVGDRPPPIPKRRDTGQRPPVPTPFAIAAGKTPTNQVLQQEPTPPAVPARHTEGTAAALRRVNVHRTPSDRTSSRPPVPVKRKLPPRPGSAGEGDPPPLPAKTLPTPHHTSGGDVLPPLPPKSPEPLLTSTTTAQPPVVPIRQSQPRSRPLSTVEKLLQLNGLSKFAELLVSNGYDDIHFISEVSEEELWEIGITDPSDRAKILGVFTSYTQ